MTNLPEADDKLIEAIAQKQHETFGEKFRLWSEFGWWLDEIRTLITTKNQQIEDVLPEDEDIDLVYALNGIVGVKHLIKMARIELTDNNKEV